MNEAEELVRQKAMVLKTVRELGEHFDNVCIMVSFQTPDGKTQSFNQRSGNWHACLGMAHEFISMCNADDIGQSVGDKLEPPDDSWKQ